MSTLVKALDITSVMVRGFDEKGYFILPSVVDEEALEALRDCLEH